MNEVLDGTGYTTDDLLKTITKLRSLADDLEAVCNGVMPATPDVFISDWFFQYKAAPCLVGKVRGHPTVKGDFVATTEVFFLNEPLGLARTSTRWYRLGRQIKPDGEAH